MADEPSEALLKHPGCIWGLGSGFRVLGVLGFRVEALGVRDLGFNLGLRGLRLMV